MPQHGFTPITFDPITVAAVKRCPQCHSDAIVWVTQMRALDPANDWYRCKNCGDQFAIQRLDHIE